MAKAIFVTYLFALTIYLISAYSKECASGPEYWCQSFQNAQDCGAINHCTDTIWSKDIKHTQVDSSTKCEWCEKIIENTHKAIENIANNQDLIQSTLINGCKLLPLQDISSKCLNVIENHGSTVLLLMKQQQYNKLCQLMNICSNEVTESSNDNEQSKMLCNVIVRATEELHTNQQKSQSDTEIFLKNDCQKLQTPQLVKKCQDMVDKHAHEIYAHIASNIESSQICDYIDNSALQSAPQLHCELCTVVLSYAKQMLIAKHTEDKILLYIDEQICSRLSGSGKKNCKQMIDNNGRELLNNLQNNMQPILLCTHFQVCLEDIVDTTSPVQKNEMHSFLINDICEKLGPLKTACKALIEKDATHLLQVLSNEIDGKDLCHMFGLCPKHSIILDQSNLQDDPSKCKRCVKDFTRRKHIAQRLVNHSSEFLQHLCQQLPQKDDCSKAVNDSITELLTFIQSLDPRDICVQLNMCDQKNFETYEILASENVINEEVLEYIKTDVCPKLGSLSSLCIQLADSEGLNLLKLMNKNLDPHEICTILDICPSNIVFQTCHDQCQCCTNKVEIYQRKLEKFMKTIVASTRIMCDHVPGRNTCLQLADVFESNVDKVVASFNSKQTCQLLNLCSSVEKKQDDEQCQTCKTELTIRQNNFRTTIHEISTTLLSLCEDNTCRTQVQTLQDETLEKLNQLKTQNLCQHLGYCLIENKFEPSQTFMRLKSLMQHQTKTLDERLQAHNICSEYGQLKSICEQLLTSEDSHRYAKIYMSLLKNNPQLIDDDLREHLKTNVNVDVCTSCKNSVQSSKDSLNNALESSLNLLLRTCDYCSAKKQCQDYYNRRFDGLKSYVNSIDPDQFCQSLHLCSTSLNVQEEITSTSNSTCILCEYVMNILSNSIHQKSTQDEIEQSLQKVCSQMPTILQNQCHELIDDYAPAIIATLIQDFDVTTICRKLNLCTKQMNVQLTHLTTTNQEACSVCDYISTYVDFSLKRNSNKQSLQQTLSNVCKHLKTEQISQCQTLIELFGTNIQQLKLGSGNNFCKQLTICQTPMSELKPGVHLKQETFDQENDEQLKEMLTKNLDETPQCMLCRYAVSYLDAALKNNKSEAAVEAALARVCTILPRKDRAQCNQFIKTYGSVIAELVSEMADPKYVCRYLGFCQAVSSQDAPATYARIPV